MSVIIRNSKIQGKGVFAGTDFKKGDIVMKWDDSVILTEKEAKKIPEKYKKSAVGYFHDRLYRLCTGKLRTQRT